MAGKSKAADKPVKATKPRVKKAEGKFKRAAYILRSCDSDMTSHNGFVWPKSGLVEAPDWKPTEECGNGLHGLLNGEGDGGLANFSPDAKWIVAEIEAGWIALGGKVKFRRANVVHCGDRLSACEFLQAKGVKGAIVGGTATAGDGGTATAGDGGTILIRFYDGNRYRIATGYVGENGIKPNTPYRVEDGKLVEASK